MNRPGAVAVAMAVLFGFGIAACGGTADPAVAVEVDASIETDACGHASRTNGSGVVVGPGQVLTAAHVVIGASRVRVTTSTGLVEASVMRLDVTSDLALLRVPGNFAPGIQLAEVANHSSVIVLGASSGLVEADLERKVLMTVDDVRSTTRSERSGFELDAAILPGDSGAGVFNSAGHLVGIVFAVPTERDGATFAVDATEIRSLLAAPDQEYQCDPAASLVVAVTGH